ncbi:hypothetical protein JL722_4562 [Aureococcus anophagefferens]|nr:hypothetical protein JL722_4562 [Aureococcus anophagefferens]
MVLDADAVEALRAEFAELEEDMSAARREAGLPPKRCRTTAGGATKKRPPLRSRPPPGARLAAARAQLSNHRLGKAGKHFCCAASLGPAAGPRPRRGRRRAERNGARTTRGRPSTCGGGAASGLALQAAAAAAAPDDDDDRPCEVCYATCWYDCACACHDEGEEEDDEEEEEEEAEAEAAEEAEEAEGPRRARGPAPAAPAAPPAPEAPPARLRALLRRDDAGDFAVGLRELELESAVLRTPRAAGRRGARETPPRRAEGARRDRYRRAEKTGGGAAGAVAVADALAPFLGGVAARPAFSRGRAPPKPAAAAAPGCCAATCWRLRVPVPRPGGRARDSDDDDDDDATADAPPAPRLGDRVDARPDGVDVFFGGTVACAYDDGHADAHYDDGEYETRVPLRRLRASAPRPRRRAGRRRRRRRRAPRRRRRTSPRRRPRDGRAARPGRRAWRRPAAAKPRGRRGGRRRPRAPQQSPRRRAGRRRRRRRAAPRPGASPRGSRRRRATPAPRRRPCRSSGRRGPTCPASTSRRDEFSGSDYGDSSESDGDAGPGPGAYEPKLDAVKPVAPALALRGDAATRATERSFRDWRRSKLGKDFDEDSSDWVSSSEDEPPVATPVESAKSADRATRPRSVGATIARAGLGAPPPAAKKVRDDELFARRAGPGAHDVAKSLAALEKPVRAAALFQAEVEARGRRDTTKGGAVLRRRRAEESRGAERRRGELAPQLQHAWAGGDEGADAVAAFGRSLRSSKAVPVYAPSPATPRLVREAARRGAAGPRRRGARRQARAGARGRPPYDRERGRDVAEADGRGGVRTPRSPPTPEARARR